MPEFTNTVYMQQPKTISRVGTSFASGRRTPQSDRGSQAVGQAAATQRPSPRRGRTMGSGTRRMTRPSGPSRGGTSGGSGGGY